MAKELDIPYTTKEGVEYLIRFILFERKHLPESISLDVVDIVILTNSHFKEISNSAFSLFQIAQIICDYAMEHNAIYYCYCSDKPIKRSSKKLDLTHQEYRSKLFCRMFEKINNVEFFNKTFIVEDAVRGGHYVHLMSRWENEKSVEIIAKSLSSFDK